MNPQRATKYLRLLLFFGAISFIVGIACVVLTFVVPSAPVVVLWAGIIGVMIGILLFIPALISV